VPKNDALIPNAGTQATKLQDAQHTPRRHPQAFYSEMITGMNDDSAPALL